MKETLIPFTGPMVRAIMGGKKTQTRRVLKQQPRINPHGALLFDPPYKGYSGISPELFFMRLSPYGDVGDRLLVKEAIEGRTDTKITDDEQMPITAYSADGAHVWDDKHRLKWKWKPKSLPSIYMPKALCRTKLEITAARLQRLHDITGKEIIAEGVVDRPHKVEGLKGDCPVSAIDGICYMDLRSLWAAAWDKINGKVSPWTRNDLVLVYEFKRVTT